MTPNSSNKSAELWVGSKSDQGNRRRVSICTVPLGVEWLVRKGAIVAGLSMPIETKLDLEFFSQAVGIDNPPGAE